jgi:hypothetical protein
MKQQQQQNNEATCPAPVSTSDRRLAANRANAALSTGPRTQAGKAASSRNAVSHGLNAAELTIFNWESPEKYAALRTDYYTRFSPIDTAESDVIDRLIDSTWRRRRALVIETTLFDLAISETREATEEKYGETACGPLHLALAFMNRHGAGVWDAIQRLLNAVDCSYSRALRDLEKLQADRFNVLPPSYLNPTTDDEVDQDAGPEPEPEPEPEPAAIIPPENPPAPLSTQNKIIEISKQTQQQRQQPASVALAPTAETANSRNEPTAIVVDAEDQNAAPPQIPGSESSGSY